MELQSHDTLKNLTHNTSHLTLFQTDYLAYGEELTEPLQDNNGTILNKIGFTGHEHDYGTGFINMQARLPKPGNRQIPERRSRLRLRPKRPDVF